MFSIQRACQLNAEGIFFLGLGDAIRAASSFQKGLDLVTNALDVHQALSFGRGGVSRATLRTSSIRLPNFESHDLGGYAHSSPFEIPDYNGEEEILHFLLMSSALIVFNLALTSHYRGTQLCEGHLQDQCLDIAMKMYDAVPAILLENDDGTGGSSTTTAAQEALCIIALNNKTQVHCDRFRFCEAMRCYETLSRWILRLRDKRGDDDAAAARVIHPLETEMQKIYVNVLIFQRPTTARAA